MARLLTTWRGEVSGRDKRLALTWHWGRTGCEGGALPIMCRQRHRCSMVGSVWGCSPGADGDTTAHLVDLGRCHTYDARVGVRAVVPDCSTVTPKASMSLSVMRGWCNHMHEKDI